MQKKNKPLANSKIYWRYCKETGQYRKRELALMPLCVKEF